MKKIDSETSQRVTFSKHRLGLFKTACELSTLYGAEVAIIVFSQNGKVYSFGQPHVNPIVNKYLMERILPEETVPQMMSRIQGTRVNELNQEMTQLLSNLEEEKKQGEALLQQPEEEEIMNLDLLQLKQIMFSMEELKYHVINHANMITGLIPINTTSSTQAAANNTTVVPHGYDFELEDFELLSSCLPEWFVADIHGDDAESVGDVGEEQIHREDTVSVHIKSDDSNLGSYFIDEYLQTWTIK
ncbi:hypothetical protein NE237_030196 [Protea cynaroides]|uniref:MADS-box domain-containing protein n=1 Tax=Protea cynaroides TaxID=273540 RepID=A0A9Q0GXC0_9MAGN|nr:hypothetical protein NE237_030196 [Protea cynaroides]